MPQPPKHFLAAYPARPDHTMYTVEVPADFELFSSGQFKGRIQKGISSEYRFELRKRDLTPAIVAGRYVASGEEANSTKAIFWTLQPLLRSSTLPDRLPGIVRAIEAGRVPDEQRGDGQLRHDLAAWDALTPSA